MTHLFADPRLELAVRAAMPQDVLAQPMSSLTHLDAQNLGIRRLRGIEQLGELRWLNLSRNPLTGLAELGANTKLIRLVLAHTGMSTLAGLEGLPNLEDLDLYASRTVTIDAITGLPALRSLDLGLCLVKDLRPLASLDKLESLTLGNPSLHIPRRSIFAAPDPVPLRLEVLEHLASLRQLRLYGVDISSARVFEHLVGLEELILERCVFRDSLRRFPALPRLEVLSLNSCEVQNLGVVVELPRLRVLDLDDATVHDLSPLLACACLEQLSLRDTTITIPASLQDLHKHPVLAEIRHGNRMIGR